jgi:hypothetical protein
MKIGKAIAFSLSGAFLIGGLAYSFVTSSASETTKSTDIVNKRVPASIARAINTYKKEKGFQTKKEYLEQLSAMGKDSDKVLVHPSGAMESGPGSEDWEDTNGDGNVDKLMYTTTPNTDPNSATIGEIKDAIKNLKY